MKITIEFIEHQDQKYETVGNWFLEEDGLHIQVSKFGNLFSQVCVAVHELIEAILCMQRNISPLDVDRFDIAFEEARIEGNTDEPGDSPDAPYRREHFFATNIERQLVHEMGIDWQEYERQINNL
jgi:hypothetical protein